MDEHKHNHENQCGGCDHGFCGGKHGILRWILGIIILIMVFQAGVRVGEIKYEMYGGYGGYGMRGGMMRVYGGYGQYGPGVMMGTQVALPSAPVVQ